MLALGTLISFSFIQVPKKDLSGWVYTAARETTAELDTDCMRLDWNGMKAYASKTKKKWALVEDGLGDYAFDDSVWQSGKIAWQSEFYESLKGVAKQPGELSPILNGFVAGQLASQHNGLSPKSIVSVLVTRRITLQKGTEELVLEFSNVERKAASLVIGAPKSVVNDSGSEQEVKIVQYPTTFGFLATGSAMASFDSISRTRKHAVELIDVHIDEFMKLRATRRADISKLVDGIETDSIQGLTVNTLPELVSSRLRQSARNYSGRKPVHGEVIDWMDSATVQGVETALYLDVTTSAGEDALVELP